MQTCRLLCCPRRASGFALLSALLLGLVALPVAAQPANPRARPILPSHHVFQAPASSSTSAAPPFLLRRDQLVERGIYRLDGVDASLPQTDLAPLRKIVKGAQVVALGETVHTSGGYYAMKHRLFRYLVEEMGFRAFAMESPWHYAQETAQYVATCQGSSFQAMFGLFPIWASSETAALLDYMCAWNQAHPNDPITFFGFDNQQPEADGPALIAFLQGIGLTDDDPRLAGLRRCDGVVEFSWPDPISDEDNQACLASLDAIDALLRQLDPSEAVQRSRADVEWAKIRSIGVRAWQGQEYWWERHQPTAFTARDRAMATTFQRMRQLLVGSQRTAIWAHNVHIAKGGVGFREAGYTVMGDFLAQEMGHRYAAVALAAAQVTIEWPWVLCGPVDVFPDSAEALLSQLGEPYLLVDFGLHGINHNHPAYIDPDAPIFIGWDEYIPREHYDGMVYLESSPGMTPVYWPSCN